MILPRVFPPAARAALRPVLETVVSMFYPPECVQCRDTVDAGAYLCAECAETAPRIVAPFCRTCSQPFDGAISGPFSCANCQDRQFAFDCAVSRFRSRAVVRELILRFKYNQHFYLRRPLSDWLAQALDDDRIRTQPADALVPVPLHPRRERARGFNQAEVLSRLVGARARLPVWPLLRRVRFTETQTGFDRAQRLQNLRGAFALRPRAPAPRGAHLLLVDDVFTTGSTVDECAGVLRRAGAASVRVLTVARG